MNNGYNALLHQILPIGISFAKILKTQTIFQITHEKTQNSIQKLEKSCIKLKGRQIHFVLVTDTWSKFYAWFKFLVRMFLNMTWCQNGV